MRCSYQTVSQALLLAALVPLTGCALQAPPPEPAVQTEEPLREVDGGRPTLHVYANLIQLPTVVLDRFAEPVRERPGLKFLISLDSGKPFPATHVRLQGQDPISLSILLDASGSQDDLLHALPEALRKAAAANLLPHDHVSIYGLDCAAIRSLDDAPADPIRIRDAAATLLATPGLHAEKRRCGPSLRLWNTVGYVVHQMHDVPGRRVLLVISNGRDTASTRTWNEIKGEAQRAGVAIFGMAQSASPPVAAATRGMNVLPGIPYEDPFDSLCQLSGGRVVTAEPANLEQRLASFLKLLRARYIIQFPRPDTLPGGSHDIQVLVPNSGYFIRPAGISVPIANPAQLADPNTLPHDPANAPEAGPRKILEPRP